MSYMPLQYVYVVHNCLKYDLGMGNTIFQGAVVMRHGAAILLLGAAVAVHYRTTAPTPNHPSYQVHLQHRYEQLRETWPSHTIDHQQPTFLRHVRKLFHFDPSTNAVRHGQPRDPWDFPATSALPPTHSTSAQAPTQFDHRLVAAKLPEYRKVDDTRHPSSQQPGVPQDIESSDNDSLPDVHWCKAFLCYYRGCLLDGAWSVLTSPVRKARQLAAVLRLTVAVSIMLQDVFDLVEFPAN
ncbi:hypothetical protein DEU56DRAFT_758742 [Suillus clintonianus]|uniref:uncharacterized protein n=1 Tax=Suillus clintonianus TaxID=1904413 RepID=UPI001B85E4B3|nr:uncharacterized protein DEU56DRAFT_758742 [Suillus clintonianus]KAG2126918.1 hypothetical protein DEU56DRAFT_758742 [Suillus clintonianus]